MFAFTLFTAFFSQPCSIRKLGLSVTLLVNVTIDLFLPRVAQQVSTSQAHNVLGICSYDGKVKRPSRLIKSKPKLEISRGISWVILQASFIRAT
jgi:hypothetical protein